MVQYTLLVMACLWQSSRKTPQEAAAVARHRLGKKNHGVQSHDADIYQRYDMQDQHSQRELL